MLTLFTSQVSFSSVKGEVLFTASSHMLRLVSRGTELKQEIREILNKEKVKSIWPKTQFVE